MVHAIFMLLLLGGGLARAATMPNLVAQNVAISPTYTYLGYTTITVTLTIKNAGTGPAGSNTTQIWASTNKTLTGAGTRYLLTTLFVPPLAAGQSVDYSVAKKTQINIDPLHVGTLKSDYMAAGTYYVVASVDAVDQVPGESDENNIFASNGTTTVMQATPMNSPYYYPINMQNSVSVSRPLQWGAAPNAARYDVYLARLKDCNQNFIKHSLIDATTGAQKILVRDFHLNGSSFGPFNSQYHDLLIPQNNKLNLFFQPYLGDIYYYGGSLPYDWTYPSNSHYQGMQTLIEFTTGTKGTYGGQGSQRYNPGSVSAVCTANFYPYDFQKDPGGWISIHPCIDIAVANYWDNEIMSPTPPLLSQTNLNVGEGSVTVLITTLTQAVYQNVTWSTHTETIDRNTTHPRDIIVWTSVTNITYGPQAYGNTRIPLYNYYINDKGKTVDKIHPYGIKSLVAADFDNDGDIDIIAGCDRIFYGSGYKDKLVCYQNSFRNDKNDDLWSYALPTFHPASLGIGDSIIDDVEDMAVGDFDRDGREDIALVSFFGNKVVVLENNTDVGGDDKTTRSLKFNINVQAVTDGLTTSTYYRGANSVLAVDLNNDHKADIVASSYLEGRIVSLENASTGKGNFRFIPHVVANGLPAIAKISYADVNGDGLMDILAESPTTDSIYWYANNGDFTFTEHLVTNTANGASCVAGFDMNQDGFMDLVSVSAYDNMVNWWGDFTSPPASSKIGSDIYGANSNLKLQPPMPMDFDCTYLWKVVGKSGSLTNADTAPTNLFRTQTTRIKITPTFKSAQIEPGNGLGMDIAAAVDGPLRAGDLQVDVYAESNLDRVFLQKNAYDFNNPPMKTDPMTGLPVLDPVTGLPTILPPEKWPMYLLGSYFYSYAYYNPGQAFNFGVNFDTTKIPEGQYKLYVGVRGNTYSNIDGQDDGVCDGVADGFDTNPRPYGNWLMPFEYSETLLNGYVYTYSYNTYGDDLYENTDQLSVIYKPDVPTLPSPVDKATEVPSGTNFTWKPTKATTGWDVLMTPASSIVASFTSSTITTTNPVPRTLAAGDIDGDGVSDLACSYFDGTGRIAWMKNKGNGASFSKYQIIGNLLEAPDICVVDMDIDGKPDILAGSAASAEIWWQKNEGGYTPAFSPPLYVTKTADGLNSIKTADLNADGVPDVLAAMSGPNRLCWYDNKLTAFTPHIIDKDNGLPVNVVAADINGDGRMDIVASFWSPNSVAWYENKGGSPPTFVRHLITTSINNPKDLAAADIDGDGSVDIALISQKDNKVVWFKNNGKLGSALAFTQYTVDGTITGLQSLELTDPNRDSLLDIVTASATNNELYYFANSGGNPAKFTRYTIAITPSSVMAVVGADLNGDKFKEVAAATQGGLCSWFNYKRSYQFMNPPVKVNNAILSPTAAFKPSTKLDAGMQYQWEVLAKRIVPIFGGQFLTRITPSSLWSFTTGQSDLQASYLTMNPKTIDQAQYFTVTFTENNIGSSDSSGQWTEIWASPDVSITRAGNDIRVGRVYVGPIKAGGSVTKTITLNAGAVGLTGTQVLPVGLYYLGMFIDPGGSDTSENNKDNNKLVKTAGRLTVTRHNAAEKWGGYR